MYNHTGAPRVAEGYTNVPGGAPSSGRIYMPNTRWSWWFIGTVFIQGTFVIALEAYAFYVFTIAPIDANAPDAQNAAQNPLVIPTFLALYIFGVIYQLVLTWDALRLKNTIQIIGLCIYNIGLLAYGVVEIFQIKDIKGDVDTPQVSAVASVFFVGSLILGFVAWKLYHEFAWTVYKHISADLRMKRRYLDYQIYIALLKFDFFFFLGFTIQFLVIVEKNLVASEKFEEYLTYAAIPVTIAVLFLAAYFVQKEMRWGTLAVMFFFVAGLVYFFSKLFRVYVGNRVQDYAPAAKSLTTFAIITILLLFVTLYYAVLCLSSFGKGLKPYLQGSMTGRDHKAALDAEMANNHQMGPVPNGRMVIE